MDDGSSMRVLHWQLGCRWGSWVASIDGVQDLQITRKLDTPRRQQLHRHCVAHSPPVALWCDATERIRFNGALGRAFSSGTTTSTTSTPYSVVDQEPELKQSGLPRMAADCTFFCPPNTSMLEQDNSRSAWRLLSRDGTDAPMSQGRCIHVLRTSSGTRAGGDAVGTRRHWQNPRWSRYRASSNNAHTHNRASSFNNAVWCPDEAPWLRWPLSGCPEPTKLWQREVDIWTGPLPCTPRHKSAPLGRELATYMTSHALQRCGCSTGVYGSGAWFHVHLHFRATVQLHRCRPVDPSPNVHPGCAPGCCCAGSSVVWCWRHDGFVPTGAGAQLMNR